MENRWRRRRSLGYFDVTLVKYCTRIDSSLSRGVIKLLVTNWKIEIFAGDTFFGNILFLSRYLSMLFVFE